MTALLNDCCPAHITLQNLRLVIFRTSRTTFKVKSFFTGGLPLTTDNSAVSHLFDLLVKVDKWVF